MKFADIPQFIQSGDYNCTVSWRYLEHQLESMAESGLDLDPDFQRGHVWDRAKQIAYVEYILRGGAYSRQILFNCSTWMGSFNTPVYLVDGKQRLEAVRAFLRDELPIFCGNTFSAFKDKLHFTNASFMFGVNKLKTRAEVLQWYLELNSGGVVHTEEELEKVRVLLRNELGNTYKEMTL